MNSTFNLFLQSAQQQSRTISSSATVLSARSQQSSEHARYPSRPGSIAVLAPPHLHDTIRTILRTVPTNTVQEVLEALKFARNSGEKAIKMLDSPTRVEKRSRPEQENALRGNEMLTPDEKINVIALARENKHATLQQCWLAFRLGRETDEGAAEHLKRLTGEDVAKQEAKQH